MPVSTTFNHDVWDSNQKTKTSVKLNPKDIFVRPFGNRIGIQATEAKHIHKQNGIINKAPKNISNNSFIFSYGDPGNWNRINSIENNLYMTFGIIIYNVNRIPAKIDSEIGSAL